MKFDRAGVACQLSSNQYSWVPLGFSSHCKDRSSSSDEGALGTRRRQSRISATRTSSFCRLSHHDQPFGAKLMYRKRGRVILTYNLHTPESPLSTLRLGGSF